MRPGAISETEVSLHRVVFTVGEYTPPLATQSTRTNQATAACAARREGHDEECSELK